MDQSNSIINSHSVKISAYDAHSSGINNLAIKENSLKIEDSELFDNISLSNKNEGQGLMSAFSSSSSLSGISPSNDLKYHTVERSVNEEKKKIYEC